MNTQARTQELTQLLADHGWRAIKAIAESLTPPIEKPEGGWDDAIALIVEAEELAELDAATAPEVKQVSDANFSASTDLNKWEQHQQADWLRGNSMPQCKGCGGPLRNMPDNTPICVIGSNNCYRKQAK